MTRQELEQFVQRLIGKEQIDANAFYTPDELLQALNQAHYDVGLDLRIPRRYYVIETPSPFALPAEALGGGLLSIVDAETNRELPISSVEEANQRYPGWQEWEADYGPPRFVLYDPGNRTAAVNVIPKHNAERKYYLHYVIQPQRLVNALDIPFNGDPNLDPLHPLIAYKAAAYLFESDKTPDGVHQANRMLQRYEIEKARLKSKVLRTPRVQVRNGFWRSFFRKG